jgi:Ca2+-binding RTX toxin-like protein
VTDLATGDTDTLASIERLRFGDGPTLAIVTGDGELTSGAPAILVGGDGNDTITGSTGDDVIVGGQGDDNLSGSEVGDEDAALPGVPDDDTFVWSVGDGLDTIHGGMEGVRGDLFQIVGNSEAETYRIYTYEEAVARIAYAGSDEVEIVVTREVDGVETAIAELTEIEEIVINGSNVSGNGESGGDTFEMYGNFDVTTNLRPNTVTILGTAGDDTVDVSALRSAHRIVFRTKGGNDRIIGTLRPQDVVELPRGATLADYALLQNEDGSTTLASATHSVTFYSVGGMPVVGSGGDEGTGGVEPPVVRAPAIVGRHLADTLAGTDGADTIRGLGGHDVISAGAGNDRVFGGGGIDTLFGDTGADRILGGARSDIVNGGGGNDVLVGGAGNDTILGRSGNDTIVAQAGDGNDRVRGGTGSDTLDMSAITSDITADLGNGRGGRGSVSSASSGSDTIWSVENIVTGSGDDVITASNVANVMDGGAGNDTFRSLSAAGANGDTIAGFQPGDKIDLSAIDANGRAGGNQSFVLVSDAFTGARGELLVTHETQDGEDFTVVQGNISGGVGAEFKLSIRGSHDLTAGDFNL